MSVTLNHITKFYGRQKALDDISLELHAGEICGFLGPNGAGKSTTMKIITGYITDFQGDIRICGTDIRKKPIEVKRNIGYLPEHNPLYPDMYIREYLLHVARLYPLTRPEKRVNEIIELTGLTPEIGKKIGQLSKGYRQRVGLAQALVHDPQVLILDEPMTGLDPNQLEEIRQLIRSISSDKTVLLSTHIMQEVEAICKRVIILNKGKIVTNEPIAGIHSLTGQETLIHIRFAPGTDTHWLPQSALFARIHQLSPDYWQGIPLPGEDPRIRLFQLAAAHQCPIIELRTEEHHLEEIFRELTRTTS